MSGIEVGTAFVRILPDMTAFNAALATQVNASTAGAASVKAASAATATTVALGATSKAAYELARSENAVAVATVRQIDAQIKANTALGLSVDAALADSLAKAKATQATTALTLANERLALAQVGGGAAAVGGTASAKAAKGIVDLGTGANAARGAFIGLSRISPVAIFGLGLVGTAAIGAGLAIKSAVTSAAEFQSQLNTFQAVTKATDEDMKQVSATALALGADLSLPATSANDAAVALTELSKAGLSVEDSLAAAKGVLQLATIAGIGAGQAAQLSASQLNAFSLAGDQAGRVTELLADASIAAQGEITDFGQGLSQAATAAAQAGVSVEDTTALLTQLAKAGIKGADAGTSLRTFLLRLVPTTKEAAQYTKALGIELDKNATIGSQLPDVIEQYRKQLILLNPQQQTLVLNQIFGQDAFRAASVIFSQEKDALRALTGEFEKTNAAQDLSIAKAEGLSGAVGSLKSQMETFGTQVGLVVDGPLEAFLRSLSTAFDDTGKIITALGDLALVDDITKVVKIVFDVKIPGLEGDLGSQIKDTLGYFFLPTAYHKVVDAFFPDDKEILGPEVPVKQLPGGSRRSGTNTSFIEKAIEDRIAFDSVEGRRARARIAKQQADAAAKDQALKGIPIPKGLQQAQVDAQINNSLSAELAADNAILKYLERKRDRLDKGTKAYLAASKQVEFAQSQRDSVQAEITGNSEAAAAERKRRSEKAIADDKAAAAAAAANAKASIDLQNARLDARLAAAQGTKTTKDDKAVYNAMIAFNTAQIKTLRNEEDGLKKTSLAYKQKELAVQGLITANSRLRKSVKDLDDAAKSSASGFSIADLFKEALNQFQEFGSNVSSSPLTPGGVRGAFGGAIAAQNPKLTRADQEKIQKAATTNELLAQILAAVKGSAPTGSTASSDSSAGVQTSVAAAKYGKFRSV